MLLTQFPEFLVAYFFFRKFINFRIFLKLFKEIPYHLLEFRKFGNFWLNGKRPVWSWADVAPNSLNLLVISKVNKMFELRKIVMYLVHIFQFSD